MSLQSGKTDQGLGYKVRDHLERLGLETPMIPIDAQDAETYDEYKDIQRETIKNSIAEVLSILGLNLEDDSLKETPKRVAKMFVDEIFWGLDYDNFPKATTVENKINYDEMILERSTVSSTCEHHLLPILGTARVAYIPGATVLGLSKLNRIVEFYSRRPQIQERLTAQIHAALCFILKTDDVAVIIEAEHLCVRTRGVEDACSDTVTSKLSGVFKSNPKARAEFIALATRPKT